MRSSPEDHCLSGREKITIPISDKLSSVSILSAAHEL